MLFIPILLSFLFLQGKNRDTFFSKLTKEARRIIKQPKKQKIQSENAQNVKNTVPDDSVPPKKSPNSFVNFHKEATVLHLMEEGDKAPVNTTEDNDEILLSGSLTKSIARTIVTDLFAVVCMFLCINYYTHNTQDGQKKKPYSLSKESLVSEASGRCSYEIPIENRDPIKCTLYHQENNEYCLWSIEGESIYALYNTESISKYEDAGSMILKIVPSLTIKVVAPIIRTIETAEPTRLFLAGEPHTEKLVYGGLKSLDEIRTLKKAGADYYSLFVHSNATKVLVPVFWDEIKKMFFMISSGSSHEKIYLSPHSSQPFNHSHQPKNKLSVEGKDYNTLTTDKNNPFADHKADVVLTVEAAPSDDIRKTHFLEFLDGGLKKKDASCTISYLQQPQ